MEFWPLVFIGGAPGIVLFLHGCYRWGWGWWREPPKRNPPTVVEDEYGKLLLWEED